MRRKAQLAKKVMAWVLLVAGCVLAAIA